MSEINIETYLENLVRNKKVLEIGGLGDIEKYKESNFQNFRSLKLSKLANLFFSIDINQEGIKLVNKQGFGHYYYGNIEIFESLPQEITATKFDIVLLLDVIEHLSNIVLALQNINKLLQKKGIVIISTPNPWSLPNLKQVLSGSEPIEHPKHTCYIVPSHFKELFKRSNFFLKDYFYFSYEASYDSSAYIKSKLIKILAKINKLFHTHILVIGEKIS